MKRFYLDLEFVESGRQKPLELISIGMVAEDGREFYAENSSFDRDHDVSDWIKENVVPHLAPREQALPIPIIASNILDFIGYRNDQSDDVNFEFVGWYCDYDWVLFCQIFGCMIDLPKGFPFFMKDLKQEHVRLGSPELPPEPEDEHHALADAKRIKQIASVLREAAAGRYWVHPETKGCVEIEDSYDRMIAAMSNALLGENHPLVNDLKYEQATRRFTIMKDGNPVAKSMDVLRLISEAHEKM